MKNSNFKKAVSILLIIFMMFSFAACVSTDNGTSENASSAVSQEQSDASIEESSAELSSAEASAEASTETSEEVSAEASSEEESSETSEEPSAESSEASSEESSKEESSKEESSNVSVLNPYEGTDIKPATGKVIAFTFDDGPSYTASTKKILDKLEELGMKATFFMVGNRVGQDTAPMIQRMIDLGCDIGNHSYDHPNFNTMTASQVLKQINDTNARLEKYAGTKATLIRPPYGNIKDSHMEALNTPIICWDIDSLDWDFRSKGLKAGKSNSQIAEEIYNHTIKKVHSGGIVLMHDIYDTTADAFCMLADKLVAEGYTLVTISELLGSEKLMCTTVKYGFDA